MPRKPFPRTLLVDSATICFGDAVVAQFQMSTGVTRPLVSNTPGTAWNILGKGLGVAKIFLEIRGGVENGAAEWARVCGHDRFAERNTIT